MSDEGEEPPMFVSEAPLEHKQSVIILHGRGETGNEFGQLLLAGEEALGNRHDQTSLSVLRRALPHARLIFPTASRRTTARFAKFGGPKQHQWFDFWSLYYPSEQPELQNEGLRENAPLIEELVLQEADKVGLGNVILGGFSNGGAMAFSTFLLMVEKGTISEATKLGGVFGLCTWLPYANMLRKTAETEDGTGISEEQQAYHISKALARLREIIYGTKAPDTFSIPRVPSACLSSPVFLAHAPDDNVVPIERFDEAAETFQALKLKVTCKTYDNLGHFYSDEMLTELVVNMGAQIGPEMQT